MEGAPGDSGIPLGEALEELEDLLRTRRTPQVADRLGGRLLERVAVLSGEPQERIQGPLVGELAEGEDRAAAEIQVAREVDARQQHVQPVGAAGLGQALGGEELGDRVLVLEGLPERLRVALALPEPPSQRLDRPLTDRVVGVVDQPGQDGIDLLPPRPSRPRQQAEQEPGVGRGREAIHEAGQDGVVPRELLLLPGAIRTLLFGIVDPLVVAADRDQGADRGVAALAVLVHERQQPVDDLGAAEPADGRQELVGEGRPARIVLDPVEEGPRGARGRPASPGPRSPGAGGSGRPPP